MLFSLELTKMVLVSRNRTLPEIPCYDHMTPLFKTPLWLLNADPMQRSLPPLSLIFIHHSARASFVSSTKNDSACLSPSLEFCPFPLSVVVQILTLGFSLLIFSCICKVVLCGAYPDVLLSSRTLLLLSQVSWLPRSHLFLICAHQAQYSPIFSKSVLTSDALSLSSLLYSCVCSSPVHTVSPPNDLHTPSCQNVKLLNGHCFPRVHFVAIQVWDTHVKGVILCFPFVVESKESIFIECAPRLKFLYSCDLMHYSQ